MLEFNLVYAGSWKGRETHGFAIVEAADEESARRLLVAEALARGIVVKMIERRPHCETGDFHSYGDGS